LTSPQQKDKINLLVTNNQHQGMIMQSNRNSLATLGDHMANERTFLAWIRTSIGIMAFGFVVEKFSLFLKQIAIFLGKSNLAPSLPRLISSTAQGYSAIFGIILVALGALICLLAFFKYKKVETQINTNSYKPTSMLDVMLTLIVFCIGLFLTIYLIDSI
jgi:putative membrane protein